MEKLWKYEYLVLIEDAYKAAKDKTEKCAVESIGFIKDEFWDQKIQYVKQWLFWKWALLVKKRNRKFAEAIQEFCEEKWFYCDYSDYHKALYCWLARGIHEHDKLVCFYWEFCSIMNEYLEPMILTSRIDYD